MHHFLSMVSALLHAHEYPCMHANPDTLLNLKAMLANTAEHTQVGYPYFL